MPKRIFVERMVGAGLTEQAAMIIANTWKWETMGSRIKGQLPSA